MVESDDYQDRLYKAVVAAIVRISAVDIGDGKQAAHLRPLDIGAVLTQLIAEFLAGHANAEGTLSAKQIRELGDEYGRVLRKKIQATLNSGKVIPAFYEIPRDPTLN